MKREISISEAVSLHWWAVKQWWSVEPKLFLSTCAYTLAKHLSPYVTILLSARLINELAGSRNPEKLRHWILLTVFLTAVLQLLTAALYHWQQAVHGTQWELENRMETKKMLDMDFSTAESPETDALLRSMRKHMLGNLYGFMDIHGSFTEAIVGGLASIIGAGALTLSMFFRPVPAGPMVWLNHPLSAAAVVFLLAVLTVLSPSLAARASENGAALWPFSNAYNRVLSYCPNFCGEARRSMDMRMYAQERVVLPAMERGAIYRKHSPAIAILLGKIAPFSAAGRMVGTILTGLVYAFVCLKAWAGAFGVGSVTQYVGAITQLCGGLSEMLSILGRMPFNAAYLRDIRAFLELPSRMYQGTLPTEKRNDREYEVEFRDVSFRYPRSETWALRHVNMKFRVGSRLAVVGMNGSGKTTFIKLLCRLYDPTEGQILLNGIDIRKYKYEEYLDVFAVVFQDFRLLALPLGQNVAASTEYDREKAADCLKKAGLGERLAAMERGLDTYLYKELAKDGVILSGGEAQKTAIARALYKDAPFLILDEPTAALDPLAEAEIYGRLNDIVGDRTAIYISHRLSSCIFCDEILVFHEGAVVQQGTHTALLAQKTGRYYALWTAQAQYYT